MLFKQILTTIKTSIFSFFFYDLSRFKMKNECGPKKGQIPLSDDDDPFFKENVTIRQDGVLRTEILEWNKLSESGKKKWIARWMRESGGEPDSPIRYSRGLGQRKSPILKKEIYSNDESFSSSDKGDGGREESPIDKIVGIVGGLLLTALFLYAVYEIFSWYGKKKKKETLEKEKDKTSDDVEKNSNLPKSSESSESSESSNSSDFFDD